MERKPVPGLWFAMLSLLVLPCLILILCFHNQPLIEIRYEAADLPNTLAASATSPEQKSVNLTIKTGKENEVVYSAEELLRDDHQEIDTCAGRYVFVHDDLPSKFNDDLINDCRKLIKWFDMCPYMVNSGLGPQVTDDSNGVLTNTRSWYATNQFSLELIFRERMRNYECLTRNSSLASAIYVPFYAGLDVGRHLWGYNISVRDELVLELAKWLESKPEWARMQGRDHFFVAGRIGWDFIRVSDDESDWGNKLMFLPHFKNMTMLTIEATAWTNQLAVPYPTYFHPNGKSEVLEWQNKVKNAERKYLYAFAGAPRPNMNYSIRGEIMTACLESKGKCKLLNCSSPSNDCENPVTVMEVFLDSTFCLQPPGDSLTRRSIFDSVLAGCIPVFFNPGSAYTQYLWYFPKNRTRYSVFIPENDVKNRTISIEKILMGFTKREVKNMREEVVRTIPKIIYVGSGLGSESEKIEDAFEVAVRGIIERVERVRKEIKEGKDPMAWFSQWNWGIKSVGTDAD